MNGEEWRDIDGYKGLYQVSSLGRVKSLARSVATPGGFNRLKEELILYGGSFDRKTVILYNKCGIRKTHKIEDLKRRAFNEVQE